MKAIFALPLLYILVQGFDQHPLPTTTKRQQHLQEERVSHFGLRRRRFTTTTTRQAAAATGTDYEYIPKDNNDPQQQANDDNPRLARLSSSYPPDTPAGLRGEAIQSALKRSNRCVAWMFQDSPLAFGLVQVQGRGCLDFINNKLTQSFDDNNNSFKRACLLTAKGRVVDCLSVAVVEKDLAYLITSPGHSSRDLFARLDPFVFPMDEIKLTDCNDAFVFTLASANREHLNACVDQQILPKLSPPAILPDDSDTTTCRLVALDDDDDDGSLLIVPSQQLSDDVVEYTFCFLGGSSSKRGRTIWQHLVAPDNAEGPVEMGALEWETLRIQAGQPAFGMEYTAVLEEEEKRKKKMGERSTKLTSTPAAPLELHLQDAAIDLDKGCYLGQEGVASMVKNVKGPPRLLYQVIFEDEFNLYESAEKENLTRLPQLGDTLFALGSNEQLRVGSLTSVAEPSGTGEPVTLALALIRRPESILQQLKQYDLQIPKPTIEEEEEEDACDGPSSGMPSVRNGKLQGLEVIVGGTFTVGKLQALVERSSGDVDLLEPAPAIIEGLAPRRWEDAADVDDKQQEAVVDATIVDEEESAAAAAAAAKEKEAEDQRKAEKMKLLKERAEAAITRRKAKQQEAQQAAAVDKKDEEAEAKRKAEKMVLLKPSRRSTH